MRESRFRSFRAVLGKTFGLWAMAALAGLATGVSYCWSLDLTLLIIFLLQSVPMLIPILAFVVLDRWRPTKWLSHAAFLLPTVGLLLYDLITAMSREASGLESSIGDSLVFFPPMVVTAYVMALLTRSPKADSQHECNEG